LRFAPICEPRLTQHLGVAATTQLELPRELTAKLGNTIREEVELKSPDWNGGRGDAWRRTHVSSGRPSDSVPIFTMFNMLNLLTRGAESPQTTETTLIQHGELR
jgi:hypothetical protein